MLVVATANYRRDMKERDSVVDPETLPEVTIPIIHIANEVIRERIAFVKEAFSLGFCLSTNRCTLLDKALRNPKMCYRLRNIDFELFESIIQMCSEKVSIFLADINAIEAIDSVYKCQYLIEENLSLFYKEFSKELNPLRLFLHFNSFYKVYTTVDSCIYVLNIMIWVGGRCKRRSTQLPSTKLPVNLTSGLTRIFVRRSKSY